MFETFGESFIKYSPIPTNDENNPQRQPDTFEPWGMYQQNSMRVEIKKKMDWSDRTLCRMPLIKRPPARNSIDKGYKLRKSYSYKKECENLNQQSIGDNQEVQRHKKNSNHIKSVILLQIPEIESSFFCNKANSNSKGKSLHRIKFTKKSSNCLKKPEMAANSLLFSLRALKKKIRLQKQRQGQNKVIAKNNSECKEINGKFPFDCKKKNKLISLGFHKLSLSQGKE